ncbi:hypothetical protein [Streptomyces sp. 135]|uniref:hypothetical protein n=1 Tax=Streptomyces sp. 135 TaxID=2838850 RepID=UPI001CBCF5FE|nr:hypothetical protein [Streptomyces sp. 135]
MGFDPAVNAEYLRKRFDEAVWESPLAPLLHDLDEDDSQAMVAVLVTRLLVEVGAL